MFYLDDSPVYCLLLIALSVQYCRCCVFIRSAYFLCKLAQLCSSFRGAPRARAAGAAGDAGFICSVAARDGQSLSQLSVGRLAQSTVPQGLLYC